MSYHVYLARQGFEASPIGEEEWIAAVGSCPMLKVVKSTNRKGRTHNSVRLATDPDRRIWLLPTGVVDAQAPNRQVIEALFAVAPMLNAGVYSEKGKKYVSPQDWEERTRSYHAQLAVAQARYRKLHKRERLRLFAKIAVAVALGAGLAWFLQSNAA